MHRAVGAAEREAGAEHRAQRAVEHRDQLEPHRRRRHRQVQRLEPVARVGGDVDLDDAVVREAREQRRLRADRDAVLRVELCGGAGRAAR